MSKKWLSVIANVISYFYALILTVWLILIIIFSSIFIYTSGIPFAILIGYLVYLCCEIFLPIKVVEIITLLATLICIRMLSKIASTWVTGIGHFITPIFYAIAFIAALAINLSSYLNFELHLPVDVSVINTSIVLFLAYERTREALAAQINTYKKTREKTKEVLKDAIDIAGSNGYKTRILWNDPNNHCLYTQRSRVCKFYDIYNSEKYDIVYPFYEGAIKNKENITCIIIAEAIDETFHSWIITGQFDLISNIKRDGEKFTEREYYIITRLSGILEYCINNISEKLGAKKVYVNINNKIEKIVYSAMGFIDSDNPSYGTFMCSISEIDYKPEYEKGMLDEYGLDEDEYDTFDYLLSCIYINDEHIYYSYLDEK